MITFGDNKEKNTEKKQFPHSSQLVKKHSINLIKVKNCFQHNVIAQDNQDNDFVSSPIDIKFSKEDSIYFGDQQQIENKQNEIVPKLVEIIKKIRLIDISRSIIQKTRARMLKNMKTHQYEFINDKSQDFSDLQKGNNWYKQYLEAFYFCSVTMATVGYGDISPQSTIEVGFCIVMVFFASAVFGFAVNTIQAVLQDFSKNEKLLMQNLLIIKNYLHKKSINDRLSKDVTEYLEYYLSANQESNQQQEENLIKQLPDSLRNDLLIESNKIVLRDCKIFQNYFSEDIIRATIPIIQEKHYTPYENIFVEGENNQDQCIYFVQEGIVEMYIDCTNYFDEKVGGKDQFKTIKRFKKGEYFGELQFFINENKGMSVRSINFSTLLKIQRKDFIQILKKFPQDYEQFCYIKDALIMQQNYEKLYQKCPSCQNNSHLLETCPFLHYYPKKYKLFAQQNISQDQERSEEIFLRSVKKSRYNLNLNEEIAIEYIEFNQELLQQYSEKYLSFNFAKCDMCTQFHKSYILNNKRKEVTPIFDKSQFDQEIFSNQIQNNYSSQNNLYQSNFQNMKNKEVQQQTDNISSQSLNQINDDQGFQSKFNKFKSLYTRTQNSKSIENLDNMEISSSNYIKCQPSQLKQKNIKKNFDSNLNVSALQNTFNPPIQISNTFIQQKNQSSLKILGVQQQPYQEVDNFQSEQLYPQNLYNTPSIQAINNGVYENTNYVHYQDSAKKIRNQSFSAIPQQDLKKNDQQHVQRIFFDQFLGQFDKMKEFQLYYPLNNYHYVISQTKQDQNQKSKLRAEILRIQRERQSKISQNKQLRNFKQGSRCQTIKQNKIIKKLLDKYEFEGRVNTSQNFDDQVSPITISNQNFFLRKHRDSVIQSPLLSYVEKEKCQTAKHFTNNQYLDYELNNDISITQKNHPSFQQSYSLFKKNVSQQIEEFNQQDSYYQANKDDSDLNQVSIQNAINELPSNKQLNSYQALENQQKAKSSQISLQINQIISNNTINSPPKQEQQVLSLKQIQSTKFSLYQYNQNEGNLTFKH